MICPSCNTPGTVHSYGQDGNGPCKDWPRCKHCDAAWNADNYRAGCEEAQVMREEGVCYGCAFWELRAREYERKPGDTLIIAGSTYGASPSDTVPLGNPDPRPFAKMRGMAGRRFDFERFDGSPAKSCYSLWYGGPIPAQVRGRMPDNARFLNGATETKAGDTTCFNPSRDILHA